MTESAGAAEYADCISAEGLDSPNECPGYDTYQSYCEASVKLELYGTRCTTSLPLLPGPFEPGVVETDRVLSMCQIELFCHVNLCKTELFEIEQFVQTKVCANKNYTYV